MGTGSSKGTTQVVTADRSLNAPSNNASKQIHMEQHGESRNGQVLDLPEKSDRTVENVRASDLVEENDNSVNAKDQIPVTQDGERTASSSDPLLISFSEKYPEIAKTLSTTSDHCQELKKALDSCVLISKTTLGHVKGLYSAYRKPKNKHDKTGLREFVSALGVPKLAYDVIVDCRTKYPEFTTWDRGKGKEKENEDEDNETEQNAAEERNKTEENVVEEKNETEQNNATEVNNRKQEEEVNEKEQTAVVEGNEASAIPEDEVGPASLFPRHGSQIQNQ